MRFTHILVVFVALVVATACSYNDEVYSTNEQSSRYLQVVGRVTQYSDCNVSARSKKEGDEPKVTSMGLALFPIEDGTIGECVYYDFQLGGSIVFIVDRHDAVFIEDQLYAMYIFANMKDAVNFPKTSAEGVGKSFDFFTQCAAAANANVVDVPDNGFPMVGSLGNTISAQDADGISLILKPTPHATTNVDGLPLVDGKPTDKLEISLKSMYAKFTFTISVKPDQEVVGNKAPRFDLLSYEVHNIAATVDANSTTNDDNAVIEKSGIINVGNYAQGATTAKFVFYLPERYLTPTKNINDVLPQELKKGSHDKSVDDDQNGYRDEDEKYHQRFKNKLVDGEAATSVMINGKYTDHQGHVYNVSYSIYLGGNNTDDFNIIRNTHYNNTITIRGIANSMDQADGQNEVSIDWRVDVERSSPLVISLRRETLVDAHFEVRPLHLRLVGETIPEGTSVTVTLLNEDGTSNNLPSWIRFEKSGTTSNHITTGTSAGKRKYFTTDLVTNTLKNSTSVTVNNLDRSNQTIWLYVDENVSTTSRAAILRMSFNNNEDVKDYKIVQHGLHAVTSTDGKRTYYIERFEEYLYNFDAEDSYGQTKTEGIPWGLNGVQLSHLHTSFDTGKAGTDWINDYTSKYTLPYYDFYIRKHDSFASSNGGTVREYPGQAFTKEIAENSTSGVRYLTMAEPASGAVEYCYNRNKRKPDGSIAEVVWYLPSADELEDFIVPAYNSYKEFQDNYYWTSQPAYIRNIFYYEHKWYGSWLSEKEEIYAFTIYEDNTKYARATKITRENGEYKFVSSGLNSKPTPEVDNRETNGKKDYSNLNEYYYLMRYWKYNERAITNRKEYGQDKTNIENAVANGIDVTNGAYDEWFTETSTGKKYYVHLGHLYNMIQKTGDEHGYRPRTQSNRVRCVRKIVADN